MNSSEVKKIIWAISLIVACGLGIVGYFVKKQLAEPPVALKAFVYSEPTDKIKQSPIIGGVTRKEVEETFGWKPPAPPKKEEPKVEIPVEVKPTAQVSNINQMFSLETILGRLAFILIKKDKVIKSLISEDEILSSDGEVLGILKEVLEYRVLIFVKGKIEVLMMESIQEDKEAIIPAAGLGNTAKTTFVPPVKHKTTDQVTEQIKKLDVPVKINDTKDPPLVDNNAPIAVEVEKIYNRQKSSFEGIEFEFYDTTDEDGIMNRKIPEEMAMKLQQKENIKKFTSSNNYDLVFQSNGVLIKSFKDPEVKKFFNAFGISDSDIILSVNGQALGNKTEDDLIALYQQITDSAKHATIEILRGNVTQKYRVSTDRIKKPKN